MPKQKKTRKQKIAITEKKINKLQYSFDEPVQLSADKSNVVSVNNSLESFFRYDTRLIYKDLFKTIIISFILIILLLGVSIYLK